MSVWVHDRRRDRIENVTDLSLAAVCVFGILIALVSLLHESRNVGTRAEIDREAIGRLSVALTQVRRRAANSLVWRDVSTGAVIYDGDRVFVPPLAYARVTLDDGSELVLDPESLTVVERREGVGLRVEVEQGTVSGRAASGGAVTVSSGSVEAELGGGALARMSVEGEEIAVDLLAGKSEVRADGAQVTLTPETALRVDADGATTVQFPVLLTAPEPNARVDSAVARGGVELSWTGDASGGELWVSSDRLFRDVMRRPATEGRANLALSRPGRYYWKVVGGDRSDASAVARFWVVPPEPPALLSPGIDFATQTLEDEMLRLEWSPVNGATRYRVELVDVSDRALDVSRDTLRLEPPNELGWSQETRELRAYLPLELTPGKYRWRVVPMGSSSGRPSAYRSLRITEKELLQAPETLDPYSVVE